MRSARRDSNTAGEADDAAVIERSLREPERFGAIFDRHAAQIQRYLCRRLNREIADDLLAETFLAAFHGRDRYDLRRRDARPWLYGIATNLAGRHRRTDLREYRLRQAIGPEPAQLCHAEQVATDVTAQALRTLLIGALLELSDGDRDVLLLIAWEQLSYEEVAAALEIPVGTVRSRLHRARRQVRTTLGQTNPTGIFEETVRNG
jgi:RNA polymerase sigma factor (sigma-70 family)